MIRLSPIDPTQYRQHQKRITRHANSTIEVEQLEVLSRVCLEWQARVTGTTVDAIIDEALVKNPALKVI
jgi:hypothetical protein